MNAAGFAVISGAAESIANTKTQGNFVFNRNLDWTRSGKLEVGNESFEMENLACVKFSHVMGKFIADYYFQRAEDLSGKPVLSRDNFYKISYRWNREEWPEFVQKMDELCNNEPNWRESSDWNSNFEDSGKDFVFISLGVETNIYIPYQTIQKLEEKDPGGQSAAQLIEQTIDSFKNLIEKD